MTHVPARAQENQRGRENQRGKIKGDGHVFYWHLASGRACSPPMPSAAPASVSGVCYHVIDRGNGRRAVFRKDADYQAFSKAVAHACIEISMPVLSFCLMPNPFHLAVLPKENGDLGHWMLGVLFFTSCEMLGHDNTSRRWLRPSVKATSLPMTCPQQRKRMRHSTIIE
jgi:REP element-mobilizing transposase RayT